MRQLSLLLLPGLHGTGHLFKELIALLPSYLKPLEIAYPADEVLGYDALVQYAQQRIPIDEPFVILGESFSGPIALELAAAHPANLKALVLCASFVTNPAPAIFRSLSFLFGTRFFIRQPPQFAVRHFLLGWDTSKELVATFEDVFNSISPEVLASRMRSIMDVDARAALKECQVPLLYLEARRDRLVSRRNLAEIESLSPGVETAKIDAPHFLLQREPERAAKAIDDFLRRRRIGEVQEWCGPESLDPGNK